MKIGFRGLAAKLDSQNALEAAQDDRPSIGVDFSIFPPADLDVLAAKALLQEAFQGGASDLFLAIDQPNEPERQGPRIALAEHAPTGEPADELSLVVRNPAPIPATVALRQLERRTAPQGYGILGLHIVMVVDHDRQG